MGFALNLRRFCRSVKNAWDVWHSIKNVCRGKLLLEPSRVVGRMNKNGHSFIRHKVSWCRNAGAQIIEFNVMLSTWFPLIPINICRVLHFYSSAYGWLHLSIVPGSVIKYVRCVTTTATKWCQLLLFLSVFGSVLKLTWHIACINKNVLNAENEQSVRKQQQQKMAIKSLAYGKLLDYYCWNILKYQLNRMHIQCSFQYLQLFCNGLKL